MNATAECDFHLKKLNQVFSEKKAKNRSYSLRAYAQTLGIHPSSLSAILKKKRPFPISYSDQICTRLNLKPSERKKFLESILATRTQGWVIQAPSPEKTQVLDDIKCFQIIAQWEPYAILSLFEVADFQPNPNWIAERLGISPQRAQSTLSQLMDSGLVRLKTDGSYECTGSSLTTSEDLNSLALRQAHREELKIAIKKLDEVPVLRRDYSSHTMAIDPKNLPKAKNLIREFRRSLSALLEKGRKKEVYQVCIQLFPLTRLPDRKNVK